MKKLLLGLACIGGAAAFNLPTPAAAQTCETAQAKPRKPSIFGRIMRDVVDNTVGRTVNRVTSGTPLSASTINSVLIDAIACQLEPQEREQAADATRIVVEKPVGATQSWESGSRPGVTGSSTVASQTRLADGSTCKDVRDVATIDGKETVVTKQMCRARGATGYTLKTRQA